MQIAVIGAGDAGEEALAMAERVGREIAMSKATLVCGGLGGVMEAACRGAVSQGGVTVGLLPSGRRSDANPWVRIAIPTGLGEVRNALVVRAADAVIAIGGEYGTLSEIAFALKLSIPVVGIATWTLTRPTGTRDSGIVEAGDAHGAVAAALALAAQREL